MFHQALIILFLFRSTSTSDVLMLTPFGGTSHKIIFSSLATGLGQNGHNVTLVSVFKPPRTEPNVNEIVIPAIEDLNRQLQQIHIRIGKEGYTYSASKHLASVSEQLCDAFYQTKIMKTWLESRRFDSIIIDAVVGECLFPVAALLTSSVVVMNTAALFPWISDPTNCPTPYSFIPNMFYSLPPKMTFWQRLENTITYEKIKFLTDWIVYPLVEKTIRKHFPGTKTVLEALADANLVLVNADSVVSITRPDMPFIKNVAGIHLSPTAEPLSEDLAKYVESAGDSGVILFSLGSIFDGVMTKEQVSLFLTAFSKLKYQFIWKYKEELESVPKNVKILKWLPQQDLLANPKVKVFITHAGLLSLQEAFYHQVPTVTLLVFADQHHNSAYLAYKNASVPLNWDNLNVDNIVAAITRAAEDKTLRENVKKMSKMSRNVQISPIKEAVYWVEYVMRHQGAPHLQSTAKQLNYFQYFLLDVFLFLIIAAISCSKGIYCVLKIIRKLKK
uniref:UDP-glycosyltransferase 213B1 n=1 Tax=Strigamia maritima TaxID=126957 RepID=A0A023R8K5_STRMM|nr:UDP-glycosyltransferase 213B1 [Strigamia maritima]